MKTSQAFAVAALILFFAGCGQEKTPSKWVGSYKVQANFYVDDEKDPNDSTRFYIIGDTPHLFLCDKSGHAEFQCGTLVESVKANNSHKISFFSIFNEWVPGRKWL